MSRSRLIATCEFFMKLLRTPSSIVAAFLVAFLTFSPTTTWAQSARDYLNTPVNQARFFLDFIDSSGETAAESDLPLPDIETVLRLARPPYCGHSRWATDTVVSR
jgi:hypothetical protein